MSERPTIYCGSKHPVNFALFEPVYQRLRRDGRVQLLLSSGRYRKRLLWWSPPKDKTMTNEAVFGAFDVDPKHLFKSSRKDNRVYDVYVSSNGDTKMIPPNSKVTVQIFQGVSFRNFAVNQKVLNFDKLFFIGPYHLRQFVQKGYLQENDPKAELIGMPKIDCLLDGSIKREEVLKELKLDPSRPVVLWCPTGAVGNSFERYGKAAVDAVAASGAQLVLKLHDHPRGRPVKESEKLALEYFGKDARLAKFPNVARYLVAADLLLSDASSVAYEYMVLDRPVIFLDVPELIDTRANMEGSNMDMNTHGRKGGLVIGEMKDLSDAIKDQLEHPEQFSPQRRTTAEDIFYKPGTATERSYKRLLELAGVK